MAPTAPRTTLRETASGPPVTGVGTAAAAFSAAMSAAVRTGTYAEALYDVAPVGTETSTFELVSWNPAGTWAVTTIWRASALASLAKAADSAAGSAVVKTLPLPVLAMASSGWLASPCCSETTSTPTPEPLIASSTSVRFVAVVSSPSERTRILR